MARLISRRRLVYYTIVVTSVCWILGTVSFFLIQSLEVSIEVKRRTSDDYLPIQSRTIWNVQRDQPTHETDKRGQRASEQGIPIATEKDIQPIIKQSSNNDISTSKKSQNKLKLITANYEKFPPEAKLKGPGAGGEGVTVPASRKDDEDEGFDQHSFNRVASDMISVHRTLTDHRRNG
ncbi:Polypeptide N-acetylgalactosaminyltransferase 1 [Desmophyllum pertusum]|uniref:Polypeptide N-acetylgalactosaminyltransferase 1 n=1 Tax=Desmophyllum pertusum TaxID=174260 RepID=A0A9W9ZHW5_9CNID|nr:Polypeptide N-acetylgalactosaminyltransferase 1 [Desmophyllum pertusum]